MRGAYPACAMSPPGGSPGTPLIQGPSRLTRCAPARPVAMVRSCRAPEPAVVALTIAAGRGRAHTAGCARCLPPAVGPTAPVVKRGQWVSMQGCPRRPPPPPPPARCIAANERDRDPRPRSATAIRDRDPRPRSAVWLKRGSGAEPQSALAKWGSGGAAPSPLLVKKGVWGQPPGRHLRPVGIHSRAHGRARARAYCVNAETPHRRIGCSARAYH